MSLGLFVDLASSSLLRISNARDMVYLSIASSSSTCTNKLFISLPTPPLYCLTFNFFSYTDLVEFCEV